jgi:F-type H+-transporting ATPase subunit a
MTDITLVNSHGWHFGPLIGFLHPLFTLNTHTIVQTWIVIAIIFLITMIIRICSSKTDAPLVEIIILDAGSSLSRMLEQSIGKCLSEHFYFIGSLFLFISFCNLAPLIPGLEEPTQDINTTFALGLISFFYIQYAAVKRFGIVHYIKNEFLTPLFLLPLHIIGKAASILSISLRLFGNIFGGSIISKIYFSAIQYSLFSNPLFIIMQLVLTGTMTIIVTTFFTIIEGLLQAFVFTMLTVTYLAIAIRDDSN